MQKLQFFINVYVVIQLQIAQKRQTIMRTKSIFGCYTLRCFDAIVFFMNNMWWYHSSKNQHITCDDRLKTFPQNELNITFYLVFFQYSNDIWLLEKHANSSYWYLKKHKQVWFDVCDCVTQELVLSIFFDSNVR